MSGMAGFSEFAAVTRNTQTVYLAQIVSLLFFVYDIVSTLREEAQSIYRIRWTVPKALYMFIRYYGAATLLADAVVPHIVHPNSSDWLYFATANHAVILGIAVNGLFFLRLFALYRRNIPVIVFISIIFLVEIAFSIVDATLGPPRALAVQILGGPSIQACINAGGGPRWLGYFTQALCLFRSSVYMCLVVKRWYKYVDAESGASFSSQVLRRRSQVQPQSVLTQFVRDEVTVFVVITLVQVIMTTLLFVPEMGMYLGAAYQCFFTIVCICATRLVLSLRSRFSEPASEPVHNSRQSLVFGNPVRVAMQQSREVTISDVHGEWKESSATDSQEVELEQMKLAMSPLSPPMAV